MDKTKISPIVLRIYGEIGKIIDLNIVHFENSSRGLYIADNDPDTGFYFKVSYAQCYHIERQPASAFNTSVGRSGIGQNTRVVDSFKEWQKIIRDYQEIPKMLHIKDLEEVYYEEFLSDIKLVDEDAQTAPFDIAKQQVLTVYCSSMRKALLEAKTEENAPEIKSIVSDVDQLEQEITHLTKAETTKRIFRIWAKVRKYSFNLFKSVAEGLLVDFSKEGVIHVSQAIYKALPQVAGIVGNYTNM